MGVSTDIAGSAATLGGFALSPALGVAGIGLGLLGTAYGYYDSMRQQRDAQGRLDALNRVPLPRYGVNPAIAGYYQTALNEGVNPRGFQPEEIGRFNQTLNAGQNTQFAQATSMSGGNLGKAIGFLGSSGRMNALNQFSANDANMRFQNQRNAYQRQLQGANYYQEADNRNTSTALQRRLMTEQALGGAISSQRDYQKNLLGNLGSDLIGGGISLIGRNNNRYNPYI